MHWFTVYAVDRLNKTEVVLLDLATRMEAVDISEFLKDRCECDIKIIESSIGGKHNA